MQPSPAGAPSAAVPGGGERPGRAGRDSGRRPPSPTSPAPLPAPAAPPAPARRTLGGGRVAPPPPPGARSLPAPLRRCPLSRSGHPGEPGFEPGSLPPRSRAGARGPGGPARGAGRGETPPPAGWAAHCALSAPPRPPRFPDTRRRGDGGREAHLGRTLLSCRSGPGTSGPSRSADTMVCVWGEAVCQDGGADPVLDGGEGGEVGRASVGGGGGGS